MYNTQATEVLPPFAPPNASDPAQASESGYAASDCYFEDDASLVTLIIVIMITMTYTNQTRTVNKS